MNSKFWIPSLLLPLLVGACASPGAKPDLVAQLMQADRDFAVAAADSGLVGWLSFMADDAVRLFSMGQAGIQGKAGIAETDAVLFADASRRLLWEPTAAAPFADGRHGYTTGRYRLVELDEAGAEVTVLGTGQYLSWWRLEDDGRWRVILDTGQADTEPKE